MVKSCATQIDRMTLHNMLKAALLLTYVGTRVKPEQRCLWIELGCGVLRVVATNGAALIKIEATIEGEVEGGPAAFLYDLEAARQLIRTLRSAAKNWGIPQVQVEISDRDYMKVSHVTQGMLQAGVDARGSFPDWRKVEPKKHPWPEGAQPNLGIDGRLFGLVSEAAAIATGGPYVHAFFSREPVATVCKREVSGVALEAWIMPVRL